MSEFFERLALEEADNYGVTEQIGELARAGKKAREIAVLIDHVLTPDQIRAVRAHLGIVYPPGTEVR